MFGGLSILTVPRHHAYVYEVGLDTHEMIVGLQVTWAMSRLARHHPQVIILYPVC